jgi:Fe2+ transport system protein B
MAGNKADIVHERVIEDVAIAQLEESFNCKCFLTSAVTGQGVEEAFHSLINIIVPLKMEQLGHRLSQIRNGDDGGGGNLSLETTRRKKSKKRKCCR